MKAISKRATYIVLCLVAFAGIATVGVAGPGAASAETADSASSLPPETCLRQLREARIARMNDDQVGELGLLRGARESCSEDLSTMMALLDFHQRKPLPPEELNQLAGAVRKRLGDSELSLPMGVLFQLALDPEISEEVLRLLVDTLQRRSENQSEPELDLLLVQTELKTRLGDREGAYQDLLRLWRLTGDRDLEWKLTSLAASQEHWKVVIEILEGKTSTDSSLLRHRYLVALARGGSYEKLKSELDATTAKVVSTEEVSAEVNVVESRAVGVGWFADTLRTIAWSLYDRGMDGEAEAEFRRLLSIYPDHKEAQAVLLNLYASEEDRSRLAAAQAEKWQGESDPQELFDEGTQRLTTGDAAGAFELLERAAPHFPELEAAWYNLGMAAYRLEKWETVAEAFEKASALNPERPDSIYFAGIGASKLGRCQGAVALLKKALEMDAKRNQAHYYLYDCYRQLGDAAAAARHLEAYRATKG
ncbi:MAG: tetratricopeptide repeat protein [Deltaproteobacteria bacterium]|nr:tetratricopeptide repeat protein [Deltaproteobacteria bacterium]